MDRLVAHLKLGAGRNLDDCPGGPRRGARVRPGGRGRRAYQLGEWLGVTTPKRRPQRVVQSLPEEQEAERQQRPCRKEQRPVQNGQPRRSVGHAIAAGTRGRPGAAASPPPSGTAPATPVIIPNTS